MFLSQDYTEYWADFHCYAGEVNMDLGDGRTVGQCQDIGDSHEVAFLLLDGPSLLGLRLLLIVLDGKTVRLLGDRAAGIQVLYIVCRLLRSILTTTSRTRPLPSQTSRAIHRGHIRRLHALRLAAGGSSVAC